VTLPPLPSTAVVGVVGKPYKVGGKCAVPGCESQVDHGHHIFRRSALAGAFFWVRLPDGQVVGNLTGLCWRHHEGITGKRWGHSHWIQWRNGEYLWGTIRLGVEVPNWDTDFIPVGPLDPQPPAPDLLDAPQPTERSEPDRCPECGQQKRRSGSPAISTPGAPRRRKSWIVKVPDDHEDGADVLVLGWGSTWAAITAGVRRVRAKGMPVACSRCPAATSIPRFEYTRRVPGAAITPASLWNP